MPDDMDIALADPVQDELSCAYAEYRSAMSGWRAAAKAGSPRVGELAADRLLQARVTLYRALVASGWGPPPGVSAQLERDAALIETPDDFEALLNA